MLWKYPIAGSKIELVLANWLLYFRSKYTFSNSSCACYMPLCMAYQIEPINSNHLKTWLFSSTENLHHEKTTRDVVYVEEKIETIYQNT